MTNNEKINKHFLSVPEVKNAIQEFVKKTGFNEEEANSIFSEFINVYSEKIEIIMQCIEDKNFEELAKKAHSLKGSFLNLYLPECAQLSIELEKHAKNNNIEECLSVVHKINQFTG